MRLFVLFFYLAALISCRKDPPVIPSDKDCPSLDYLLDLLNYDTDAVYIPELSVVSPDTGIYFITYNLSMENEVISLYNGYLTGYNSNLVKYNLITGELIIIMENPGIFSLPEISSSGWLLFTWSDFQLWKIKTNGDSLTQLTSAGINSDYCWSPDGTKFLYSTTAISGIYIGVIADKNGVPLDTLPDNIYIDSPVWSPDGKYIAHVTNSTDINLLDPVTYEVISLINEPGSYDVNKHVRDIKFYPDSKHILWVTNTELHKTNIETGFTEVVATTCDSQGFNSAGISGDGQNILIQKTIYEYYDSKHLYLYLKCLILDAQGNEIKEIVF